MSLSSLVGRTSSGGPWCFRCRSASSFEVSAITLKRRNLWVHLRKKKKEIAKKTQRSRKRPSKTGERLPKSDNEKGRDGMTRQHMTCKQQYTPVPAITVSSILQNRWNRNIEKKNWRRCKVQKNPENSFFPRKRQCGEAKIKLEVYSYNNSTRKLQKFKCSHRSETIVCNGLTVMSGTAIYYW